jgi:hypothetical protein
MTRPIVNAIINFSTGAGFAQPMIIDAGQIGINALADAAAVVVDVSDQVDSINTTRGRSAQADQFQAGTMTLRIVDTQGNFNPQNTASPYYSLLSPMRKVQITASYNGQTYPIFAGFITAFTTQTPKNVGEVQYTTIQAVDAFRLAQNAQISTVTGATAGETTGSRIGKILNTIGWPSTMRSLSTGLTTVQADTGKARTGLAALQTIETTEYGALYVSADGNFIFQDRNVTAGTVDDTATVFADDGSGISYSNAVWRLDDTLVFNQANVSRVSGSVQSATNSASVDKYFAHTYNAQNLMMETDADALNLARAYVASRAETSIRCDAITLDLYTDNYNDGIIAGLSLDYFNPVTVTTTQSGSSTLTKTLQVFGVSHDIKMNSWKTTLTTLEPIIDSFILGTNYGILGTNVLSY